MRIEVGDVVLHNNTVGISAWDYNVSDEGEFEVLAKGPGWKFSRGYFPAIRSDALVDIVVDNQFVGRQPARLVDWSNNSHLLYRVIEGEYEVKENNMEKWKPEVGKYAKDASNKVKVIGIDDDVSLAWIKYDDNSRREIPLSYLKPARYEAGDKATYSIPFFDLSYQVVIKYVDDESNKAVISIGGVTQVKMVDLDLLSDPE